MVLIPSLSSFSEVAFPTPKSSLAGRGQRISLKLFLVMMVVASGFLYSLPIFASTLLYDTPAERVIPNSSFTVFLIVSAICLPLPKRLWLAVTSSHDSSMLKGSTISVKRWYMLLILPQYSLYLSIWGFTSTRSGHFFFAFQMVSAVTTPYSLASWFLASMIPWRLFGSPLTAMGLPASSGWARSSTAA